MGPGCSKATESLLLPRGPSKKIVHGVQQATVKVVPRASVELGLLERLLHSHEGLKRAGLPQ